MYAQQSLIEARDLYFNKYHQTLVNSVQEERIRILANKIKPAGKFCFAGKTLQPLPYPGYAVVAMLTTNKGNDELSPFLTAIQTVLKDNLQPYNSFYMLPPDSFHQTIANTLSAGRYIEQLLQPGLDATFPDMVSNAFKQISIKKSPSPLRMRLIGLSVAETSIVMSGTFEQEADYNSIVRFREGFYGDETLATLGVKKTRPFIGHITIAYAEQKLNKNQKQHLADTLNEINGSVSSQRRYFNISNAALCRYDNLSAFYHESKFPVYNFCL
jgi:hypothetical protein